MLMLPPMLADKPLTLNETSESVLFSLRPEPVPSDTTASVVSYNLTSALNADVPSP